MPPNKYRPGFQAYLPFASPDFYGRSSQLPLWGDLRDDTHKGTWLFKNITWPSKLTASLPAISDVIISLSNVTHGILEVIDASGKDFLLIMWSELFLSVVSGSFRLEVLFEIDVSVPGDILEWDSEGGHDGARKGIEFGREVSSTGRCVAARRLSAAFASKPRDYGLVSLPESPPSLHGSP